MQYPYVKLCGNNLSNSFQLFKHCMESQVLLIFLGSKHLDVNS